MPPYLICDPRVCGPPCSLLREGELGGSCLIGKLHAQLCIGTAVDANSLQTCLKRS